MWEKLYEQFHELPESEQKAFLDAIKQDFFTDEPDTITILLEKTREVRFSSGLYCLHCGSTAVKRNGKYRSRQRYLCKDCGKSFNDMTHTPFSGSHYPEKWVQYIEFMVEGYSLPKIAEELGIHISTAFYWRHKILNALKSLGFDMLQDIVKSDETLFRESMKEREVTHRKPRKRGGRDPKRGFLTSKSLSLSHTTVTVPS